MISRTLSKCLKSFICGALISSFSYCPILSASAASSTKGSKSSMSALGYSYTAQNTIITGREGSDSHKFARGYIDISANTNVPGGYMGGKSVIYNSAGTAVSIKDWEYSSSNISGFSVSTTYTGFSGTPYVYAKGYAKIWNGTGYWTYDTFATPYLNDYT